MIRSMAFMLVVTSGWSLSSLSLDRLRWNARERTATGVEALEAGEPQPAIEALETAARLDPSDPHLRFNAGSGHLVAGSEGAMEHLEVAAETASESLLPAANYNLGNARFGAGNAAGAIEAFENALRSRPDHEDAKFNLELALQLQQQQQEQQQSDNQSDKSDNKNEQQPEPSDGAQQQQEPESGQNQEQPQDREQGRQSEQLPQFEDQPDMSAEQAAAILEAVENLEREQRRRQAREEIKKRPRKGKDW